APAQLATAVLAVIAGRDLEAAATGHGLHTTELTEAVQTYQAAGYAALERRAEQQWHQVLIEFPTWEQAETIAATQLAPRLDDLRHHTAIDNWWFLRKHPCWRIRLLTRGPNHGPTTVAAITKTLTELTDRGAINGWRSAVYEPEHAAFGGPTAMTVIHDLFCADSHGVLDYARTPSPAIGRRELSIMLLHALLDGAGLDWFERGDVFHRVAQLRPVPAAPDSAGPVNALAGKVRTLLHATDTLLSADGPAAFAVKWRDVFQIAGKRLGDAAADGHLDRGLRALLTHVVIFHWNRLGLSATTQGILARAATAAFLPPA
ncbi:thiopeptide-type bacteriocin biosynthesis protein, partial [Actinomadura adrarensis]